MAYTLVDVSVLNTTSHITGHVYLITNGYVILGHNRHHNHIDSFGGYSEEGETLLETVKREFQEESLECIFNNETLEKYLWKSQIIMRKSDKGEHYSIFAKIDDISFDINSINISFKQAFTNPNLTEFQKEHDYIVMVLLSDIHSGIIDNHTDVFVKDPFGDEYFKIRPINIVSYIFLFANLL